MEKTITYKDLLLGRVNKLSEFEKEWANKHIYGWYNKYLLDYNGESYSDNTWENLYLYSFFGQYYLRNQTLAKKFLSCEKKMNYVMDRMEDRKRWYSTGVDWIRNLQETGELTQHIMGFMIARMRKENFNIFESYLNDPIFESGAIVQFRSNIGVDAVIEEHKYSSGVNHYGANARTVKDLKTKTMMVLGESPLLGGKVYAGVYAYKEKVGGSRYYRVLPIGDTKVYVVVEKFLKKCRTKAVKDAQS